MTGSSPFSPKRARGDFIAALPAIGIGIGAVLGALLGVFWSADGGSGAVVTGAGIGIALGLVVGIAARALFRDR
jgi:hypothetical protein